MKILGIETSCDETAVGIVEGQKILSNVVASQAQFHAPFGGVVPEIASRHHIENLPVILDEALLQAKVSLDAIDGIAATYTPGLLGALLVGLQYAKSLSLALNKPFIGVNHLEGHLNAVFLEEENIDYPYIGLIASGGHTHLYKVESFGKYQCLGATRDDACGEAYDKVAKLLGLGYPGGPLLEQTALQGNPKAFRFTQPKFDNGSLDFSFSGVKTACLLQVKKQTPPPVAGQTPPLAQGQNVRFADSASGGENAHSVGATGGGETGSLSQQFRQDLAASFQEMATNFLIDRLRQASRKYRIQTIIVTGGVAANQTLRKKLNQLAVEENLNCFAPSIPLCTDNGAMIAYVGGQYLKRNQTSPLALNAQAYSELTP